MKIMVRFCVFLICASISLIYPELGIAAGTGKLPVEAFSTLPKNRDVQISPDGKKIIYFQNVKDKTVLVSFNIETGKVSKVFIVDNIKLKFRSALWANNDTVLFSIMAPANDLFGNPTYQSTLCMRKADASEDFREIIKPRNLRVRQHYRYSGGILSLLSNDPGHILMAIDDDKAGHDTVYKINIYTSETSVVQPNMENVSEWVVDQQDRLRAGIKYIYNTSYSILIYDLAEKTWNEIFKTEIEPDKKYNVPKPIGFGADPNILYLRADHNGKDAIFKADVTKPGSAMELVVKDDNYDISGGLIYSPKTRDAVGVYHDEAEGGRIYWDEEYKRLQAAVDRALPDTTNYLNDFSEDGKKYLVYSTSDRNPGQYFLGDLDQKTINIIGDKYPQLEGRLLGSKKVTYTSRSGESVEAYLTLPADYKQGIPCPVVIFPNTDSIMWEHGDFDYWVEFFASKGILVFQPNFKHNSGSGTYFVKKAVNDFGATIKDALTDAVNWLVEQKLADPGHIAIAGRDYGGYAALVCAAETQDLFRCAISFAGVSDLLMLLKSTKLPINTSKELLVELGKDKKSLNALSPGEHVDKIKIPILLGHGDLDRTVPVDQSNNLAKKLKKKKKVFTYIELKNGDHWLSYQKNRHIFFNAMDEFLDKYLLNDK